jgi:RsiW-degrading membrane proteinase PrsW (M82 family)
MRPLAYITLSFAPVIAIALYLYFHQRYNKEYGRLLLQAFLAGAFGVLVLIAAETLSSILGLNDIRSLKRTLFFSFITFSLSSELGKFILYRYYIIPNKLIDRPIHGIIFSIMTALGFSTFALILFMVDPFGLKSYFPYTLYTFVMVPANIMFSVILGFFVGMAKFMKARFVFSLTGLLGAAFFHGIFTFCMLTSDFKLLSLFSFGSTVIVFILGLKAAYTVPEPS